MNKCATENTGTQGEFVVQLKIFARADGPAPN
jgi:hypothetical protein